MGQVLGDGQAEVVVVLGTQRCRARRENALRQIPAGLRKVLFAGCFCLLDLLVHVVHESQPFNCL